MRLLSNLQPILNKSLFISSFIILIVTLLQLVFIGKNLTFSTRFTPVQSQQNHLRNQQYITQAQVLIILLAILYIFVNPATIFSTLKKPKRIFFPSIFTFNILSSLLIFLNIYFLTGATQYRQFMTEQYENFIQKGNLCNGDTSLCIVGTCVRLEIFKETKAMALAFTVINCIFTLGMTLLAIFCNKKRKSNEKMELIV